MITLFGAPDVLLLGRSGRTAHVEDLAHLAMADCLATIWRTDVSSDVELRSAIAIARRRAHCTRGVLHAAGLQVGNGWTHTIVTLRFIISYSNQREKRLVWCAVIKVKELSRIHIYGESLYEKTIHAQVSAGILKQSVNSMRAVISPKLGAAEHMSRLCDISPLAFNVLYSSVSSIAGFSGHANYCAANAALDRFAGHSALCGLPTVAVQWGAWSSIGKQSQSAIAYDKCTGIICTTHVTIVTSEFTRSQVPAFSSAQVSFKDNCYAGMASKKLTIDASQAQSMGMLAPTEGLETLASLIWCHPRVGICGVASQEYWKVLLRSVKDKPKMFAALYESTSEVKRVREKANYKVRNHLELKQPL